MSQETSHSCRFSIKVVSLATLFLFITHNIQCSQGQLAKPGDECDSNYPYCLTRTRQLYCDAGVCRCHYHEEWDETAQSCRLIEGKLGCESQADCLTDFDCVKAGARDLYGQCHNPNAPPEAEEDDSDQGEPLPEEPEPEEQSATEEPEEAPVEDEAAESRVTENPPEEGEVTAAPEDEQAPAEAAPEDEQQQPAAEAEGEGETETAETVPESKPAEEEATGNDESDGPEA